MTAVLLKFPRTAHPPLTEPVLAPVPATEPTLPGHYLEHADRLVKLKQLGIEKIYGIYPLENWQRVTQAAKLYLLPMTGQATSKLGALVKEARFSKDTTRWGRTKTEEEKFNDVILKHRREGTLLSKLFPDYREPETGYIVNVTIPQPPKDELQMLHRARLAGYSLYAACPAEAISVSPVELKSVWERQKLADPIWYGRDGELVVVFGYYGQTDSDPEMLKSLVAVLEGNRLDL